MGDGGWEALYIGRYDDAFVQVYTVVNGECYELNWVQLLRLTKDSFFLLKLHTTADFFSLSCRRLAFI